jgi:uncharacterized membrane protein YgcG
VDDFRNAVLRVERDRFVSPEERERLWALPTRVELRDRQVEIDYDVEEEQDGRLAPVARLRLPEKLARSLTDAELPALDRPLRFVVLRGQRGALRAAALDELQEALDRPWSPDAEPDAGPYRPGEARTPRAEREVKEIAGQFRRERESSRGRHGRGKGRPSGAGRDGSGRDGGRGGGTAPGGAKFGRGGRRKRGR